MLTHAPCAWQVATRRALSMVQSKVEDEMSNAMLCAILIALGLGVYALLGFGVMFGLCTGVLLCFSFLDFIFRSVGRKFTSWDDAPGLCSVRLLRLIWQVWGGVLLAHVVVRSTM